MKPRTKIAATGAALAALTLATTLLPAVAAHADDHGQWGPPKFASDQRIDVRRDVRRDDAVRHDWDRHDSVVRYVEPVRVIEPVRYVEPARYDVAVRPDGFRDHAFPIRDERDAVQETKNTDRNLATLGIAAAAVGVLTHNNTLTAVGAVGAVVAGTQYENARKAQSEESNYRPWGR